MLNWIIGWSLTHRPAVLILSALLVGSGLYSLSQLEVDAFPDTTPVQVQVNTVAPALGPIEIEQQITMPVESAIAGLSRLENVRSISKFGLSQVVATFQDGMPLYFARQLVGERLATVELPRNVERPELGPPATGLGEVFHYLVTSAGPEALDLRELTAVNDWIIKPRLKEVEGVAEVNTWGGKRKRFEVCVDPSRLVPFELTLDDVTEALKSNNTSVGGSYVVEAGEASLVHGVALTATLEQIGDVVIEAHDGVPVRVRDVAEVREGHDIRRGAVTAGGKGEVVLGLGFMLMGENSHPVTQRLEAKLEEIRPSLPPGVDVRVVYKRTELVDRVIATVKKNLLEGALLVVAVLFVFLGNLRAGLIVALAIPLAMLFSFSAMLRFGISASLLSLGAIDFGLVVDSSVILVENSVRKLAYGNSGDGRSLLTVVRDAAVEVRRPTMFGELIIMVVYLPILLLEGVEGKLFRPMALTVVFALASSLVFSVTLMPVLCSLVLSHGRKERGNVLVHAIQRFYRPIVHWALGNRGTVVITGLAVLVFGGALSGRLGSSFIPRLYEEALTINTIRLAGVSLEESVRYGTQIERFLLERFPDEIRDIWTRTGTPEVATDPMGLEVSDVYVMLTPRERWKRARTQAELTEVMAAEVTGLPGMRSVFTQPIELRMNEMTAGVRADVGIKIVGDDFEVLKHVASEVDVALRSLTGSADVATEQITGQPVLEVRVDQGAISRLGVPANHVLEVVEAVGGIHVGSIRQGQRRFDLVAKLADTYTQSAASLGDVLVPTVTGERFPLKQLARISHVEGPSTITREWGRRRLVVQCNVRGRDLAGFVEEARRRIAEISLPAGYYVAFGGQFEHLQRARTRLALIVPLTLATIFGLLYVSTGTVRDSLIVLTGAPCAVVGGILALWIRDMDFTISAAVGFIAVSGVSMLAGLVLVSTIKQKIAEGLTVSEAIEETRLIRLRPILMTALVAALGFVPMALNTGVGAEVQRPLATVVIGGIIADNLLTLLLLPSLYSLVWGTRTRVAPASTSLSAVTTL